VSRTSADPNGLTELQRAALVVKQLRAKVDALERARNEPIAIVGLSCRFPGGAVTPEAYWQLLANGVDAITEIPPERWDVDAYYDPDPDAVGKMHVRWGGFLDDIDAFDADLFGIFPREAMSMDPQQRLLLETSWEALERAGLAFDRRAGNPVGVFVGITANDYAQLLFQADDPSLFDPYYITGNPLNFAVGRLSYTLGLQGPCVALDTACSSSLVAVHQACQSLRAGECDAALAGGVNVILSPENSTALAKTQLMAPDGHCKTFDASADGYVRSEGCGMVVLKRLADAQAEGDNILAVIRGSAVNHNGPSSGLTVPSGLAQQNLIRRALSVAGLEPAAIDYVEAHGTGTALGDPIEVKALGTVFAQNRDAGKPLLLGSVKSNLGHLESAAGVAGLIKTILSLQQRAIPAHLRFSTPNPHIPWQELPIKVATELTDWPAADSPRRAGVSSFGASGVNAHVVLEEAPPIESSGPSRRWQIIPLSAKTEAALDQTTVNLAQFLKAQPEIDLADVAYTLQVGRRALSQRRIVVSQSGEDAATALETLDPKRVLTHGLDAGERTVGFLFPGVGDHYAGLGRQLYEREAGFRRRVDHCCELLQAELGCDLREILFPPDASTTEPAATNEPQIDFRKMLAAARGEGAPDKIHQTRFAHPAVFVIEYALAGLWLDWGIRPQAMLGYSIGEYVAACVAGVLRLEDALRLVSRRAQLIENLPGGVMLAIPLAEEALRPLLNDDLSLASINGPALCVVAGSGEAITALEVKLVEQEIVHRRIPTSHAFHSHMLTPIREEFLQLLATVPLQAPEIPYISNLTGTWVTADQATDPEHWWRHTCTTVRFSDGIERLLATPKSVLLEIGPGQSIGSFVLQHPAAVNADCTVLPSLPNRNTTQADDAFILNTLARLWLEGVEISWRGFYRDEKRRRVPLPTYPFQRQRHWLAAPANVPATPTASHPAAGQRLHPTNWFYAPSWRRTGLSTSAGQRQGRRWLLFLDDCGVGGQLLDHLFNRGDTVVTVAWGEQFRQSSQESFEIDPTRRQDYDALLQALREDGLPDNIVHLWSVTPTDHADADALQDNGFYSLLFLTQAIGDLHLEQPLRIGVVSSQMQCVTGADIAFPEKATVLGFCKVVPQEYRFIRCASIDLDAPTAAENRTLAARLVAEFAADLPDDVVAYRGRYRWTQRYEAVTLPEPADGSVPLRQGGVYLITGGLGGLGLEIADYLARQYQARLVLLNRSSLPPKADWAQWLAKHDEADLTSIRIRRVQALEQTGAEVLLIQADVADSAAVQAAVRRILNQFQTIHGVIHTAGAPGAGLTQLKTKAMAEAVFAAKLQGTHALEQALAGVTLDFLMLFASNLAITGGYGQLDYCAANAFLDAFAQHRAARCDMPVISVDWDMWQVDNWQGDLMKDLPQMQMRLQEKRQKFGITAAEGQQAFARIVAGAEPQVVVSTRDFDLVQNEHTAESAARMMATLEQDRDARPKQTRPNLRTAYVAPESELEQGIAALWQELFGIEQIGVHDNFLELGGHSILGMQLIARLRQTYQLDLPLQTIFESPTVAELAVVIEERLLAEIENLSGDEVERMMASEQGR